MAVLVFSLQIIFKDTREIMARPELIENLNKALSLELTGIIQYSQHSYLVTGAENEEFRPFFRAGAKEAQAHSEFLGDKIVALGGIPTVEPAEIRQSTDLKEMLQQNLQLERDAMAAYMDAWRSCGDEDLATRFWLESQVVEEQTHIDELERLTSETERFVSKEAG